MKKILLKVILSIFLSGCVSYPTYYDANLLSNVNGRFKFKIKKSKYYCEEKKSSTGEYVYPNFCGSSDEKIYRNHELAINGAQQIVENVCKDGTVKFMGHNQVKEYAGNTDSYCYGTSNTYGNAYGNSTTYDSGYGISNTYGNAYGNSQTSSSSSCTGSYPIYNYSTDIYFRCFLTRNYKNKTKDDEKHNNQVKNLSNKKYQYFIVNKIKKNKALVVFKNYSKLENNQVFFIKPLVKYKRVPNSQDISQIKVLKTKGSRAVVIFSKGFPQKGKYIFCHSWNKCK